jgi:hypothetical protein
VPASVIPLHPICTAIRRRSLLEFDYKGLRRVVAPYSHGRSLRDIELLRGVQLRGESRSDSFGFGKLWTVGEMKHVRVLDEDFVPDDPDYNPEDIMLAKIHCRVRLDAEEKPR